MKTQQQIFELAMQVRDYECDMQRIVNNANYMNYLEHARHKFLESIHINFAELTKQQINMVVTSVDLNYLAPLVAGDEFVISVHMQRVSRLRFSFDQKILRMPDRKLMLKATTVGTVIDANEKPCMPESLEKLLGPIVQP